MWGFFCSANNCARTFRVQLLQWDFRTRFVLRICSFVGLAWADVEYRSILNFKQVIFLICWILYFSPGGIAPKSQPWTIHFPVNSLGNLIWSLYLWIPQTRLNGLESVDPALNCSVFQQLFVVLILLCRQCEMKSKAYRLASQHLQSQAQRSQNSASSSRN